MRKQLLFVSFLGCLASVPLHGAEPPKESSPPTLRLPDGVRPLGYAVHLRLIPGEETFNGELDIDVTLDAPRELIWLNGSPDIQIESASLRTATATEILAKPVPGNKDFVGLRFAQAVPSGNGRLHIRYHGALLRHEGVGLFQERDGNDAYIFSDFEPFDARRAFPCFDEPTFKVPVRFMLDVPEQHLATSNAPIETTTPLAGGLKRVLFRPTPPLPTYLWALAVGPFGVVDAGQGGVRKVPLRILTLHGREATGKLAASVTAPLIDLLERYTGVAFPYDKLDQVTVPNQSHAMENPGLITYGQRAIQIGPEDDTIAARRRFTKVCAHELAHHWTGDLVTLRFWEDTWLNESFASFLGSKVIEQFKPEWNERFDRVLRRQEAMDTDSLLSTRSIRQPIVTNDDIHNAFDSITYQKGQSVLTMIESWIGEATFARGLHRYLTAYAHRNASAEDYVNALVAETAAAGKSSEAAALPRVLKSFLDQPGVPLVTVEASCHPGENSEELLSYKMRRYLPLGIRDPAAEKWIMPLCLDDEQKSMARKCVLSESPTGELLRAPHACSSSLVLNFDSTGYYRLYDRRPQPKSPSVPEQAMLQDPQHLTRLLTSLADHEALLRSGDEPIDEVLSVYAHARKVPPLYENRQFQSLTQRLLRAMKDWVPQNRRLNYQHLVDKWLTPRLMSLGLRTRPQDSEDERLTRAALLPLVLGDGTDAALHKQATELAMGWLRDHNSLDAESAQALLPAVAERGDKALWQALRDAVLHEKERIRRALLWDSLGAFRDPALVQANLPLILGNEFEARETMRLLMGATGQSETREVAYAFVKQNWTALIARLPRDAGANLARVAAGFCDQAKRDDAAAFFKDRSTRYSGGPRVLAQTIERIEQCDRLRRAHESRLAEFLATY